MKPFLLLIVTWSLLLAAGASSAAGQQRVDLALGFGVGALTHAGNLVGENSGYSARYTGSAAILAAHLSVQPSATFGLRVGADHVWQPGIRSTTKVAGCVDTCPQDTQSASMTDVSIAGTLRRQVGSRFIIGAGIGPGWRVYRFEKAGINCVDSLPGRNCGNSLLQDTTRPALQAFAFMSRSGVLQPKVELGYVRSSINDRTQNDFAILFGFGI